MKKSCPRPGTVDQTRRELEKSAQRVAHEYRWLFGAAHDRTVGDDVRVRSHAADPTGGLIASDHKRKARESLERAHEKMLDALSNLRAAESELLHTMDRFDPPERPEALRYPRTASNADLAESRDARRRREEAGEGVPV